MSDSKYNMTEEEIKEAQEKMNELKILPWEEEENRALLQRGMRLYEETIGDLREKVSLLVSQFESVLGSQKPVQIREMAEKLKEFFDSIEEDDIW